VTSIFASTFANQALSNGQFTKGLKPWFQVVATPLFSDEPELFTETVDYMFFPRYRQALIATKGTNPCGFT